MIKIGGTEITDVMLGSTQVNQVYVGSNLVWRRGSQPVNPYTLYMWLDGADNPVSSKWVDKTGGLQWAITGVTHGTNYYEFLNPTSGTASKYLSLSGGGASINLGKHWKVVADVAIASNTQNGYVLDMCAYGSTANGYNGIGFNFNTNRGASSNVKPGGNTAVTQNNVEGVVVPLSESWNRMTLTWECTNGNTSGNSIILSYIGTTLCRYTDEFADTEWKNFRTSSSPYNTLYIGRGFLNTSSNKSPLRFRLYDLKIYKKNES